MMNKLKIDHLNQELLTGPTYDLIKGTCKSAAELEYHLEEVFKATNEQLDWNNPKGMPYPHNLSKPLPLIPNVRGRFIIPFDHFINNDLEYLNGGSSSRKYTTSITKLRVWICYQKTLPKDVYSRTEIIAVMKSQNHGNSSVIVIGRDYGFVDRDGKLTNLSLDDRYALNVALRIFYTSAGNPIKEILLKLNLPDHKILKDGGEVKEFQRSFRHFDTERLSRSDKVLKLKNFKKDATLKLSRSTNQECAQDHISTYILIFISNTLIEFSMVLKDCDGIPKRPAMFLNLWRYKVVRHRYSNPMIQPEPEGSTQGYPLVSVEVLRFDTSAGNPVKEILLKLNIPDHKSILTDSKLVNAKKDPLTFDDLMASTIDFTKFSKNRLKKDKITKADLEDQHDYENLEDFFFNNDLEYLKTGNKEWKYVASLTKTKAARYDLKGDEIDDLVNALHTFTCGVIIERRVEDADELYKFSDGTLKSVHDNLHKMLHNFVLGYNHGMPKRAWTEKDHKKTDEIVKLIDNLLLER
ncbi:hypothetical protein Tco_0529644 [Tanacetum coccineum]